MTMSTTVKSDLPSSTSQASLDQQEQTTEQTTDPQWRHLDRNLSSSKLSESGDDRSLKKMMDTFSENKSRTRNSSSSTSCGGSNKPSRKTSEHNSRSQSPRLHSSHSVDSSDSRPLKFDVGPPIDKLLGVQQESFSSSAYGGLGHHALSRISATSSFLDADYQDQNSSISQNSSIGVDESGLRGNASDFYISTPPNSDIPNPLSMSMPTQPFTSMSSASSTGQGSNGFRKKKSSWNSALFPTYKSRSIELKKLFSALPPEERLIVEYSCALQKDILIHGRLYCTANFLCFYANIFGCKTVLSIRWEDVKSVTKEKIALMFPNAIQVNTKSEKHFFASFASRDQTFETLRQLWKAETVPEHHWRWVHSFYGEELGLTSDDEADYASFGGVSPSSSAMISCDDSPHFKSGRRLAKSATSPANLNDSMYDPSNMLVATPNTGASSRSNTSSETSGRLLGKIEESGGCRGEGIGEDVSEGSQELLDLDSKGISKPRHRRLGVSTGVSVSDLSDSSSDSETDLPDPGKFELSNGDEVTHARSRVTLDSWRSRHDGRELNNQTFPIDVDTLFQLLFSNSKFFMDFHTARKTLDIVQSPWQMKSDGSKDKVREVSFTLSLTNSMGYKHSQVTETQTMSHESCPGEIYLIDVETNNSGIPYADSFYVTSHFCLSKVYDGQSNLCIMSSIKYKKVVWGLVKALIEKNTWSGLEDFYSSLSRSLSTAANDISRGVGISSKKVKKHPRRPNGQPEFEGDRSQREATVVSSIANSKRARQVVNANLNGILSGETMPHHTRPSSLATGSFGSPSALTTTLVNFILFLLSTLLVVNILLFYRLHTLETRLESENSAPFSPDTSIFIVKPDFPKGDEDWLRLLHKQESLHQLEVEKWHELLGTATHLLRQTEESLSDLQRSIHPMALKKLRHSALMQEIDLVKDNPQHQDPTDTLFKPLRNDESVDQLLDALSKTTPRLMQDPGDSFREANPQESNDEKEL